MKMIFVRAWASCGEREGVSVPGCLAVGMGNIH